MPLMVGRAVPSAESFARCTLATPTPPPHQIFVFMRIRTISCASSRKQMAYMEIIEGQGVICDVLGMEGNLGGRKGETARTDRTHSRSKHLQRRG